MSNLSMDEWEKAIPEAIRSDSLWKMKVYRLALWLSDAGWGDVTRLMGDHRTVGLSDQLYRALGSISANLAEGYSRSTGKDRARFWEYALGSARETRDWYFKARHVLTENVSFHRIEMLTEVIRLLITMIPPERDHSIREGSAEYVTDSDVELFHEDVSWNGIAWPNKDIPFP